MTAMSILLGILFIGLTLFAVQYGLRPTLPGGPSIVALAAAAAFGDGSALFVTFAAATALILFLAANTSFNAFPRLAAILAEDGYMPRQFSFRGDRLAYSWGIVLLAAIAFGLLWAFGGDTHALIPLYSVGVFVCFTLSQIGMVKHWREVRETGWRWRAVVNAVGRGPDRGRPGRRRLREVPRRRLPGRHPRAAAGRDDAVHQAAVHALDPRGRRVAGPRRPRAVPRGARGRADPRPEPGGRPGDQCRAIGQRRRPGRLHHRRPRRGRPAAGRLRAPGPGRPAGRRRVAVSDARRAAARLPRRPRLGMAARQAVADHLRRHPRVRGPQLVGTDPLQPVGQAAADRAARTAAYGRRGRPVPTRGSGAVRGGRRTTWSTGRPASRPPGRARRSTPTPPRATPPSGPPPRPPDRPR